MKELSIFEKFRGLYTPVIDIRRKVFAHVSKIYFEDRDLADLEKIPYEIINEDSPHYRCCRFKEYYILRERVRLALGANVQPKGDSLPLYYSGVQAKTTEKVLNYPIVNVIRDGCERCPTDSVFITDLCQKCIAHPCILVCPKNAIYDGGDRMVVDDDKCIKCNRCIQVCPYNAPVRRSRPCADACGVDAISSDSEGYATIDPEKCVSCGLCIVSCPFAAIAEKSAIAQVIEILKSKENEAVAIVAPSFVSQFGPLVSPEAIFEGIMQLGFEGVDEIAFGADIGVLNESAELIELAKNLTACDCFSKENGENPHEKRSFVGTSCCPSWVMTAKKYYPDLAHNISESYTPMVETAKKIKLNHPNAKVVMIGPCIAKKAEALDKEVDQFVDHVITFEELAGMFRAKNIDLDKIQSDLKIESASQLGRGFAIAGGVANAVITQTKRELEKLGLDCEIPHVKADTLRDCRKMIGDIAKGKLDPKPLLVEGMACPFGCIGGPGTLAPLRLAQVAVNKFAKKSKFQFSDQIEKSNP